MLLVSLYSFSRLLLAGIRLLCTLANFGTAGIASASWQSILCIVDARNLFACFQSIEALGRFAMTSTGGIFGLFLLFGIACLF